MIVNSLFQNAATTEIQAINTQRASKNDELTCNLREITAEIYTSIPST